MTARWDDTGFFGETGRIPASKNRQFYVFAINYGHPCASAKGRNEPYPEFFLVVISIQLVVLFMRVRPMSRTTLNRWWPVTYDFGLIKAPISTVLGTRHQQYLRHGSDGKLQKLNQSLELCFRALEPLSFQHTKELYRSTKFGWTAYFANGTHGSDPFLPMMQLSKALGACAMRVCKTPVEATYQAVIWEVYDTADSGADKFGYRRSITAANDGGGWVFEQSGTPFPFEDLERYTAARIRDRFTEDLLCQYLQEMDISPISDNEFMIGDVCKGGILARPPIESAPHFLLEEIIAD